MKKDEFYMKAAIKNAMKAKGKTGVNPLVGCVIVKNDKIISIGFHEGPGSPHAEIKAINSAAENLYNSTIYITLEPCNLWGRTPPCLETIEQIPFKRIVIGMKDPNPLVSGKSIKHLIKKKYEVTLGVLKEEIKEMNPYFKNYITKKQTYMIMKAALTLDGYLNVNENKSKYFTSDKSRILVHKERFKVDAILVGANTVNTDNPILDCRFVNKKYKPSVIILDFSNKVNYSKTIMTDKSRMKYIFISEKFRKEKREASDLKYIFVKRKENTWKILRYEFHKENIISIFIEGGADTFIDALKNRAVDEIQIFYAPLFTGKGKRIEINKFVSSTFILVEHRKIKNDLFARYKCLQD